MKRLSIFILLAVLMAGCNNTPKAPEIKPQETTIKGALSGYYRVVDKKYQLEEVFMSCEFDVEIERIGSTLPFELDDVSPMRTTVTFPSTYFIGFGLELLDKKGNILKRYEPDNSHCSSYDVFDVIELSNGETCTLNCSVDIDEELLGKVKSFRVLSAIEGSSSKPNTQTQNTSNDNWDSVLNEYEKFVDNYIKLYKKAMAGDVSAITEYATCLENAEELQTKLEKAESTLTSTQLTRYTKITNKMMNAIQ